MNRISGVLLGLTAIAIRGLTILAGLGLLVVGAGIVDELVNGEDMTWGMVMPVEATVYSCAKPMMFGLWPRGTREACRVKGMEACREYTSGSDEECRRNVEYALISEYDRIVKRDSEQG